MFDLMVWNLNNRRWDLCASGFHSLAEAYDRADALERATGNKYCVRG